MVANGSLRYSTMRVVSDGASWPISRTTTTRRSTRNGRRGAGVDHRAHVERLDPRTTELLHHEGRFTSGHQLFGQGVGRLGHQ